MQSAIPKRKTAGTLAASMPADCIRSRGNQLKKAGIRYLERRCPGSNRGMADLQSAAFPLGYSAATHER